MRRIVIQETDIPSTSLVIRSLPHIDFIDAFKCQLPEGQPQNIDSVPHAIFSTMPQWIAELLKLRDAIVRPFGLKASINAASSKGKSALKPGMTVGVFEVIDRELNEEIILGENDKHLDYRVSVRLDYEGEKVWVIVSTAVNFNNWLGRAYFVPVRPVHRIIVPAMMRYGLERSESNVLNGTI